MTMLFYSSVLENGGGRQSIISLNNKVFKFDWKNPKVEYRYSSKMELS